MLYILLYNQSIYIICWYYSITPVITIPHFAPCAPSFASIVLPDAAYGSMFHLWICIHHLLGDQESPKPLRIPKHRHRNSALRLIMKNTHDSYDDYRLPGPVRYSLLGGLEQAPALSVTVTLLISIYQERHYGE